MTLALLGAFGAALCYGAATILQSVGVRSADSSPHRESLDPRLLVRAAHQLPYLLGLGLDGVGFLLSLAALRALPLFVVESVVAANVAVTAVLAVRVLRVRLTRLEWSAVAFVVLGLAMLGVSAAAEKPVAASRPLQWWCLVAGALVLLLAVPAARLQGRAGAATLGALSGMGFGVVGVATRILPDPLRVGALLRSPATYALLLGALGGMLLLATALQRGAVTTASAALVVTETAAPALVGLLLLGDSARQGWGPVAAVGFVLAVAGAVGLGRLSEPAPV